MVELPLVSQKSKLFELICGLKFKFRVYLIMRHSVDAFPAVGGRLSLGKWPPRFVRELPLLVKQAPLLVRKVPHLVKWAPHLVESVPLLVKCSPLLVESVPLLVK